jgi:hypothetical protein
MSRENRTIADLDAERQVWIADSARNRSRAHLNEDCPKVRSESEPRTRRMLHPNLPICKYCDPTYELPRPGGRSPAWDLRKQGGER